MNECISEEEIKSILEACYDSDTHVLSDKEIEAVFTEKTGKPAKEFIKETIDRRNKYFDTYIVPSLSNKEEGRSKYLIEKKKYDKLRLLDYCELESPFFNKKEGDELNTSLLYAKVGSVKVDLKNVKEGDIISLNEKASNIVDVVYGKHIIYKAESISVNKESRGLRISEEFSDTSEKPSLDSVYVVLGTSPFGYLDFMATGEGSIIPLDAKVNEYYPLVRNNKILGYGELCVKDNMLSFKLIKKF